MANRKPKVPENADDKEQSERFIGAAREHETDETGKEFERAFKNIIPSKPRKSKKKSTLTDDFSTLC